MLLKIYHLLFLSSFLLCCHRLTHSTVVDDPCEVNPDSEECAAIGGTSDGADSGEVPTWTWGVIIGLVVVAFVVGAFILSRGGDGDDGKDWDY